MTVGGDHVQSRRDRVRAATRDEILRTARKVLVAEGSGAISLRAIAREMGMTAPAIYRYFDSHEELIRNVVAELFTELADHLDEAAQATAARIAAAEPELAETAPWVPLAEQLMTACRAFRDWALRNRHEFSLIFGSPLPALDLPELPLDDASIVCGMRFGQIFFDLFAGMYRVRPFPVPADDDIEPSLRSQLIRFREVITVSSQTPVDQTLPLGTMLMYLRAWVTLYGAVSLEVFYQLRFALQDAEPMFELVLADLADMIGLSLPIR